MRLLMYLDSQIEKMKECRKLRLKRNYKLARSFGFSAAEAQFLAHRGEKYIRKLAGEKNNVRKNI